MLSYRLLFVTTIECWKNGFRRPTISKISVATTCRRRATPADHTRRCRRKRLVIQVPQRASTRDRLPPTFNLRPNLWLRTTLLSMHSLRRRAQCLPRRRSLSNSMQLRSRWLRTRAIIGKPERRLLLLIPINNRRSRLSSRPSSLKILRSQRARHRHRLPPRSGGHRITLGRNSSSRHSRHRHNRSKSSLRRALRLLGQPRTRMRHRILIFSNPCNSSKPPRQASRLHRYSLIHSPAQVAGALPMCNRVLCHQFSSLSSNHLSSKRNRQ